MRRCGYILILAAAALQAVHPSASAALWPFSSREELRQDSILSGRAAMEDELYDLAQTQLKKALERSETDDEKIEVAVLLARSYRSAGNFDQAATVLDKLTDRAPESELYAEFLSETAYLQFDRGDYAGALQSLLASSDRGRAETRISNARLLPKVYVKLGQREDALQAFADFNEKYPSAPDAPANLLEWAGVLTQASRIEDAVEILRQVVDLYTDTRAAWTASIWEAQLLLRMDRWDAAHELLSTLVADEDGPTEILAEAHFYLARVYEHRQDIDRAVEQLLKIEDLGLPEDSLRQGRIFRAKLLFISGREDEGLELVHAAIRSDPDDPEVAATQLEMANLLLDRERVAKALREYQYYLETFENPAGEADAFLGKGWAHYLLEEFGEAALMFRKAMEAFPPGDLRLEALYKSADSYFQAEIYAEALDIYNMGVSMYPDSDQHPEMMFQSAEVLRRLGRIDESLARLAELEKTHPDSEMARKAAVRGARIEEERREWERAIKAYTEVAERYAGTELELEALHNRAIIYYRLSRFAHAIEDFERLVDSNRDSALVQRAFFMRGWCYYLIGEEERALEICNQFLEKYPDSKWSEDVNFWIGNYLFNQGEFDRSEKMFVAMAATYPDGNLADSALFWAAQAALKQKEYLRTIEYLARLLEKYPESARVDESRFAQGDALAALGRFSEAILVFENIIKNRNEGGSDDYFVMRAWGRMGDCNYTLGTENPERYNQAIACYDKILMNSQSAAPLRLQAEFKIGRSLEKLDNLDGAFERYMNVVYEHLKERKRGEAGGPIWFTRAAFGAAQIAEARQQWRQALNIYQRVLDADVSAASEAQKRIRRLRMDHWILF